MTRRLTRSERESGAATVEFVITTPLLLLAMLVGLQVGLVAVGQNAAENAADEGAFRARAYDGSASEGRARAEDYLGRLGGPMFSSHSVRATRDAQTATVTVTATVKSVLPSALFGGEVRGSSSGPVERFVEEE